MNCWKYIGPEWKTEEVFRVREILKCEHIPFKMPFTDVFFTSLFHMPAEDKRWAVLVREKDRDRVVELLAREGLADRRLLEITRPGAREAADGQGLAFVPALPR